MNRIEIYRKSDDRIKTIGEGQVVNEFGGVLFQFYTVELPWKDNANDISCIPKGIYTIHKYFSPTPGREWCYMFDNVPGRSYVQIHVANHFHELRGCIAPGLNLADIDGDGHLDVTSSRAAMAQLLSYECTEVEII